MVSREMSFTDFRTPGILYTCPIHLIRNGSSEGVTVRDGS